MPIVHHPNYIPVATDAVLWRYMDLEKFESLLTKKALFFCRSDKFSDPFEGSIPKKEAAFRMTWQKLRAKEFKEPFNEKTALKAVNSLSLSHIRLKRCTVVNCWHINNNESDAMWRLYLKDNEGVAIQTLTYKLTESLSNVAESIGLSKVRYLDYENDTWYHETNYPHNNYNFIVPFIHKRKEFVHESELRLFRILYDAEHDNEYWDKQEYSKGIFVEVDINKLVDKIVFPPTADDQVVNKIVQLAEKHGFKFQFLHSKLKDSPIY